MTSQRPPPSPFDEEISGSEDAAFEDWPWAPEEENRALASVPPPPSTAKVGGRAANEEREARVAEPPPASASGKMRPRPRRSIPPDVEGWPPPEGTILLGKYRLEKVLGKGGMGVVVVAQHLHLQQKVAIKFLHPIAMSDPDVMVRFQREGRVLAQIQSEHVVRIFDVGTLEKGEPYMVMEYLEGTDLSKAVKVRGPLPVEEAVDYLVQTCEPLAEAHLANIIHRDLKPSNLYLARRTDGTYSIKLIDFGISKIKSEEELSLTKPSVILGSPLYISPEQLRSARDVDARSDVWALGVILYKLLTGRPPFIADTIAQLCTMIIMNPPPPIAAARADVPPALEAVIGKCIHKDPAQRFQTVEELAEALVAFCAREAEAHESVVRIRRLFKNAAPRAVGISAFPLPIAAPTPAPGSLTASVLTDGNAAVTVGAAPPPILAGRAPSRSGRALLTAVSVGLAFTALIVLVLVLVRTRAPAAPPAPPPQEDMLPPPTRPVDPAPSAAPAPSPAEIAVPPSTGSAAPSAAPAPVPVPTVDLSPSAAGAPKHAPAYVPPAPPRKPGKPVDNSEFGDRK